MKKCFKVLIPLAILIIIIVVGIVESRENSVSYVGPEATEKAEVTDKPVFVSGSVEPKKVAPGDEVTVTVEIKDNYGITEVKADMGGIAAIELKLKEGTIKEGVWQGVWLAQGAEPQNYQTMQFALLLLPYQFLKLYSSVQTAIFLRH